MRPTGPVLLLLAATLASPLDGQTGPVGIAVLPFEDRGSFGEEKEVFQALALGIPATLVSELRQHTALRLSDPARVGQALRQEAGSPQARLDAATAAKVGKDVGARYAVTGSFAGFYGKFHLDARVVDTDNGQILKVVSNRDPKLQDRADLYRIIQMVAHRVLEVASPEALRSGATEGAPIPTDAIIQFSRGLLDESQGNKARAGEHFQQALALHPNYADAEEGLRRVRGS